METIQIPAQTLAAFGGDELRARVFHEKYALRNAQGHTVEHTPADMWRRVARELASVEPTDALRSEWEERFLWLLSDFRMVPGGRVLFAVGNPRRVTAANCYVIPMHGDSLEDILDWCKEAARTYSFGGGVGGDISVLRPRGAPVNNAAITSSGAVSFMELMSTTTGTIGQAGRRGALMITIADNHPDVMEFTQVKRNMDKVRYANISVRVTDDFMRAVERNADHQLLYESDKAQVSRTIPARELWHQMIAGAHGHAEPGLIFWDTVKRWSTSEYDGMEVATTNPCSEIPLEPYGNCNLSNINLSQFVLHEFTARACINWPDLERAARYTTRFLDNLIDYNADKHPLPPQREASLRGRRIGVGFTGLADMLIKLGLRYDTPAAIEFTDAMFDRIKNIVYDESANLAGEKGPFPAFDRDRHLQGAFISTLHTDTLSRIQEHGLRNVALLTVPPVGSGAVLAGTTSGIEPIFALSYTRRSESLSQKDFQVYHPLVAAYMKRFHLQDETRLPPIFVTAHHIRPEMRVRMQAAIQKHIDHSISSTVNLPEHATFEDVERIYFLAWQAGLKGITVYREGSREGILVTADTAKPKATPAALLDTVTAIARQAVPSIDIQDSTDPAEQIEATVRALAALASQQPEQLQLIGDGDNLLRHRPERLDGATYRVPTGFGTAFITITEIDGEPFEVFARLGKAGSDAEADAEGFGRLCSTLLRLRGRGTGTQRLELIAEQLEGIGGSRWHGFGANRVRSLPDAIAVALRKHLAGGQAAHDHSSTVEAASTHEKPPAETGLPSIASNGNFCPRCQQRSMVAKGGCIECRLCGFREC